MTHFNMSDQKPVEKDAVLPKLVEIARRTSGGAGSCGSADEGLRRSEGALRCGRGLDRGPLPPMLPKLPYRGFGVGERQGRRPGRLCFLDKDGKLGSRALDLYRLAANFPSLTGKFKVGSITRSDRRRTRGIQLADALAHALFSFNREVIQNPHLRMGPLLTELTKDIQGNWLFTRPEEVERWAQELASAVGGNGHSMQLVGGPAA